MNVDGAVETRGSCLREFREGAWVFHRPEQVIERVTVAAHPAIVLGEVRATVNDQSKVTHVDAVTCVVWRRTDIGWKLAGFPPAPRSAR